MPGKETDQTATQSPPLRVRVRSKPAATAKPARQPPYAVILHNDSVNRVEWVVDVLTKVLRCGRPKATWLTLKVHFGKRGVIWSGSKEVAEFKAEQIRAAGPDPHKVQAGAQPLSVTIEALPH